jgi:hypothetical protein
LPARSPPLGHFPHGPYSRTAIIVKRDQAATVCHDAQDTWEVIVVRSLFVGCAIALGTATAAGAAILPAAASVALSTAKAGARPVTLSLQLRYEMQCARPGPGPLVIAFPAAERLPSQLDPADVLVNGHPATQVERNGRVVSVALPIQHGPLCDVIAPATLKVVFTRSAGLGNPMVAGTYSLTAHTPRVSGRTTMTIR